MPLSKCLPSWLWLGTLGALFGSPPGAAWSATLEVGMDKAYPVPSAAAAAARDGDHITIAAGVYSDCAVWRANGLTIEGAAPSSTVITGPPCSGKALFITLGDAITIRALTLTGAHVGDFNGAGIRAEGNELTVEHVRFLNNEDGLLAGTRSGATITVRDSEFIGNGTCAGPGGCAHGIYAGSIGLLRVERSRFFATHVGHHIKSRAERTEVVDCDLEDGASGTSSFAVDIPNGGAVLLRGNRIQKGPKSSNHTAAFVIGAEGTTQATPEIIVEANILRVEGDYKAYLLDNRTATVAGMVGNVLDGNAWALHGAGTVK